jgi:hypothetical protein
MIEIKKSPTADSRTCDVSKVDKKTLLSSSRQHISDVDKAIDLFKDKLTVAQLNHDFTKIDFIDDFYRDFKTKFETQSWYDMHKLKERHHLAHPEGIRDDVHLMDVLEYIADCVMAGMARSGEVHPVEIDKEILYQAFLNTVELLKANVTVIGEE